MEEKIIIDGVDVSECKYYVTYTKDCINDNKSYNKCESYNDCYYKQLKRLEQENEELSKLIRGTKDYAEVCSVCKDEVTIYPNISGRTDYTQNEVECLTLAQIITRKNNLEQENEELKQEKVALQKSQYCVAYEKDCYKSCQQQNCAIKNYYNTKTQNY